MPKFIEIKDNGLFKRMKQYPNIFEENMADAHTASLLILHEAVPPYPPKPATSTYIRTGTLGRKLGSSMSGGAVGTPEIFVTRELGPGEFESRFGTSLEYAAPVIGTPQKFFFSQYWWQLDRLIGTQFNRIKEKFQIAADAMAAFLEGK